MATPKKTPSGSESALELSEAYRDLLEKMRYLHVDKRVLEVAEKVVREHEAESDAEAETVAAQER